MLSHTDMVFRVERPESSDIVSVPPDNHDTLMLHFSSELCAQNGSKHWPRPTRAQLQVY